MLLKLKANPGWFQLVLVIGIIAGAVLLSTALSPSETPQRPQPVETPLIVSTVQPEPVEFQASLRLNGSIEARTLSQVVPQVSGQVVEVSERFRPGAEVARGDLLFRIDPADYELAIERTLAEIEAARSELALLEAQGEAERRIWNQEYPDRQVPDLIAKVPQIAAARARIRSAEAAREAAVLSLQRTEVRAPFAARVLDTQLDIGQVVGNNSVGSLYALDSLEIAASASAQDIARLGSPVGLPVEILHSDGSTFGQFGEVARLAASVNENTRLRTLYIAVEDPAALTVGEFVALDITARDISNALQIPSSALTSNNQLWVVDEGRLNSRFVQVLGRSGVLTTVAPFDSADGVVAVPPANGTAGLSVEAHPQDTSGVAHDRIR